MRLQVESTTTSWRAAAPRQRRREPLAELGACASVNASRSRKRDRRRLVRDTEGEQLVHTRAGRLAAEARRRRRVGMGARAPVAVELGCRRPLEALEQVAEFALDAAQAHRHDRDIDEDQREEDDVGGGDVLARGVQGSAGATSMDSSARGPGRRAALRARRRGSPHSSIRCRRRCAAALRAACFAWIS